MSTTTTLNPTSTFLKNVFKTLGEHPRTVVLGGVIVYVIGGFTFYPKGSKARQAYFRPFTNVFGVVLTLVGFGTSLVRDIRDAISDGRTQYWKQGLDSLTLFLKESGLDDEFGDTMSSSHFLASTMVLTDLQNKVQRQRRTQLQQKQKKEQRAAAASSDQKEKDDDEQRKKEKIQTLLEDGQHYMRFATTVYGEEMIAAAELAVLGKSHILPTDTKEVIIKKHCQLIKEEPTESETNTTTEKTTSRTATDTIKDGDDREDDEIWCDYDYDFSTAEHPHAQHCMVVYCSKKQELVLSIRGTFSLSGIITDLAGYCEPFCEGNAHSGMALAAKDTWDTVWSQIIQPKLSENKNKSSKDIKRFTITGHSLGAGVACLVTILVYHQKLQEFKDCHIQCYAMAPPPVFCPMEAASEAVANTVAYIHNWDIVPSLSVDAIRRLMACLGRIVDVLNKHPLLDLAAKRWKLGNEPNPELLEAYYTKEEAFRVIDKAPMLVIPAKHILWMEKDPTYNHDGTRDGSDEIFYEANILDPTLYAERVLDLELPDCVSDHMTDCYEVAFDSLLKK